MADVVLTVVVYLNLWTGVKIMKISLKKSKDVPSWHDYKRGDLEVNLSVFM